MLRPMEDLHDRRRRVLLALGAVTVLLGGWWRLLVKGSIPTDGHTITLSYPHWAMLHDLWSEPHLPLWNPARNLGEVRARHDRA